MAYFAQIENNNVINVIIADQEFINSLDGIWIETFDDGGIRKNRAGIGYTYDAVADAFISPSPGDEYVLNTETYQWDLKE